ncbi:hypothetical protein D3C85_937750 [compost metagenome]
MLDATRIALPRLLLRRGHLRKSLTMSCTTLRMRDSELSTLCRVPHCFFSSSFCQSLRSLETMSNHSSTLCCEVSRWSISRAS